MAQSRHRKNHKQKAAARKNKVAEEKAKAKKFQMEFINNLIRQEQEKGMFNNNPAINGPIIDGPIIDGPTIEGPSI